MLIAAAGVAAASVGAWRRARRAERDNPPVGRFVEADGVQVHYLERGEGPAVVLLHGNGSMVQDFAISGLIERLARRRRVVVFDRPGFGYTLRPRRRLWGPRAQARLLRQAMRRLRVERADVVGHSWGTLVALALAIDDPAAVRSLALLSGYYFPSLRLDALFAMTPALPLIGTLLRYTLAPPLARLLTPAAVRKIFAPPPVTPEFARRFPTELALRPWQMRAVAVDTAIMAPAACALSKSYARVNVPVLLVAGSDDRIVETERQSGRLARVLPQARLVRIAGEGHMIHHSAGDRVAKLLRNFLEEGVAAA